MDEFAPIILLLIFWVFIGIPISLAKKASQQQQKEKNAVRASKQAAANNERPAPQAQNRPAERLATLTPTVSFSGHDDSVYAGSLNANIGEGYDPCHDEQLSSLPLTGTADSTPPTADARPSLPFGWTGSDMVRGIVMSEILKRK